MFPVFILFPVFKDLYMRRKTCFRNIFETRNEVKTGNSFAIKSETRNESIKLMPNMWPFEFLNYWESKSGFDGYSRPCRAGILRISSSE